MKRTAILLLSIIVLIACNPKKAIEQPDSEAKPVKECFQYIAKNDTVSISLDIAGNAVTGLLLYNFYEKDKSQGTLIGEMKGDTLVADYTFFAEGVTSVSEVAFIKRNNQLIQGFGETTTSEGKQAFKNRSTLDFNDSLVLEATECEKNKRLNQ